MGQPVDGIILVDKNEGETSFDVVRRVKRILKVKKVGHAGTLDPFATGLLILLLGEGTKLSPFLMDGRKKYRAVVRLGIETDTLDPTGNVIATNRVPEISREGIEQEIRAFVGEIEQVPPLFSAVKFQGSRAYQWARKGVEIRLKKRKVTVFRMEVLSVSLPDFTLEVECSKGTYMRSLAADMGRKLGTGGHLAALRRLAIGPFCVEDAWDSRKLHKSMSVQGELLTRVIPLGEALPHLEAFKVDGPTARKIRNGYQPFLRELESPQGSMRKQGPWGKILHGEDLVAVVRLPLYPDGKGERLKIQRVFH
ncbi:MAG: tRNA pseudouridine(55) synthase TruB [Deltaproteobacteria bacterium]|nr:tRNA pseudouridine(55) synthase TruB [Deltaproteobacteria bacterium]MBW2016797.1 tRNA pseudouridine(55) synthase TruB [Deltaproteobacteria bacterium]MBW2128451.1 tRNA pseudouridine(55) synthase TruB [Deltaproteobacteria bacterium]MBW2303495.1 tRNA pseudouridine(55) synthase TruB [Deltaproteobacteria bacterium]